MSSNSLEKFSMLNCDDGFWRLSDEFAELIGFSEEQLRLSIPEGITPEQWATILALQFLAMFFDQVSEQWMPKAQKARTWLHSSGVQDNLAELEEVANKILM